MYRGWQPALGRAVAVKVLDAPATDAESQARFQREGRAMGALSGHPHVVPVFATGSVGDHLYLVMPMLEEGSLADQLANGALPPAEVAELGRGLADALAAAHAAGVLHRDVKPANVLRTAYGSFQLADFGVARFVDTTQTMGGAVMATVAYAAPEVLRGEPSSTASDVYSLGATLHAALRGKPPYESRPDEAAIAVAVRVLSDEPPDLRAAGVPPALAEVIDRAMERDPADRWSTAAELRDALAALHLSGAGETPLPVDATVPMGPPTAAAVIPPDDAGDPTQPVTAVAPAPVPPALERERHPDRRHGRGPVLVALVLLIAAVAAALLLLGGDDGDGTGDDLAANETSTTQAPVTSEAAPSSTTASTAATTTAPAPAGAAGSPGEAVRSYYALMDAGRIDEGFARLSPDYQARTGEESYRGFWETVDSVEVLDVEDKGKLGATATLHYTLTDGSTSTEDVRITFVEDDDGLLIDDYRVD